MSAPADQFEIGSIDYGDRFGFGGPGGRVILPYRSGSLGIQVNSRSRASYYFGSTPKRYSSVDFPTKPFSIRKAARLLIERPSLRLRSPRDLNAAYERVTDIRLGVPARVASLFSAFDSLATPLPRSTFQVCSIAKPHAIFPGWCSLS